MAALVASRYNPILKAFCQCLLANGKAKKLALTALMRKLITRANRLLKFPILPLRLNTVLTWVINPIDPVLLFTVDL